MAIDWQRLEDDDDYADMCTRLYETHRRGILRYCVTPLGDPIREMVMQEVFVTMVKTLRTYRPGPPVEGWLFGMAKQQCQQTLRNRTRRQDIANALGPVRRQVVALLSMARRDIIRVIRQALTGNPLLEEGEYTGDEPAPANEARDASAPPRRPSRSDRAGYDRDEGGE